MPKPSDQISIEIRYDDELRGKLESGFEDPYAWIDSIEIGGADLLNGDGMKEYLVSFLSSWLQIVPALKAGERTAFRSPDDAFYFVFDPNNDEELDIRLSFSEEIEDGLSKQSSFGPNVSVGTQPLIEELVTAAEEFHNYVESVNPSLTEGPIYDGLKEDIQQARAAMDD